MQTGRMSRMTTSFASFPWARAAMWRACSSEVRAGFGPFFAASLAAVEAELRDQAGHRRRHEVVDRLAAGDPVADVARGDRDGPDLEELDALGAAQVGEHAVETVARIARPRRDGQPRALEDALRILPVEEVAELVGSDQEDGIVEAALPEHVDGALVFVELDTAIRKGGAGEPEPGVGLELHLLVARPSGDEDHEVLQAELLLRGVGEREVAVVRRVEGPAEQTSRHASSTTSSPRSTSSPGRAPAAFSAAASSSSPGSRPATRKPRSVR